MEKIGFVLVHGAGLGAWVWDRVKTGLNGPVLAVDLPGRGKPYGTLRETKLEDYIQSVIADLRNFPVEKVILVGHSFSGEIILRIATLLPERVAGLVFVAAIVPPSGKSMLSLQPWLQRFVKRLVLTFSSTRPPDSVIRVVACSDLDEKTCADYIARYTAESPHVFFDPVEWKLPADMPRTYIKTLRDHSVIPLLQERMLERLHPVHTATLDSGHVPMLSKPKELAAILNDALGRIV